MNIIKPLDQHVVNILSVYAMADRHDREQGMTAYQDYHDTMQELATKHFRPLDKVCAVFAILSPNATYASNLSSADKMLDAHQYGMPIDSFEVSTYRQNKIKAWSQGSK